MAAVPVYATVDALAQWMDQDLPANGRAFLRSASIAVREYTATAWYSVDGTGLPTAPDIAQTFSDATCAQAAFLIGVGYDPLTGLLADGVESEAGVGSARVVYADGAVASARIYAAIHGLCSEARRIITLSGIVNGAPWIV